MGAQWSSRTLRLGGDYRILKTMRRWLPIIVGAGVFVGSVVPPHFSPHSPDRPTVTHEQPALPAHPEHEGDHEIKPGPPQIQTPGHATATSVNAKTWEFVPPQGDQPPRPVVRQPQSRPDAESRFTVLGLVVVALVLVFYGALGAASVTQRLARARTP